MKYFSLVRKAEWPLSDVVDSDISPDSSQALLDFAGAPSELEVLNHRIIRDCNSRPGGEWCTGARVFLFSRDFGSVIVGCDPLWPTGAKGYLFR